MPRAAVNPSRDIELKSVLVATDFSSASENALRHAVSIAQHYGAKLYLMHVVSSLGLTIAGPDALAQATRAALRDAQSTETQLLASGALRDIGHQVIVTPGDVWPELQAVIRDEAVNLLVVGTHGRAGWKKLVLGSVAEQIFRHARCPVLTVGPCSAPDARLLANETPAPVLFATDFSEASLNALPYATSLANQRRTKLVLLHMLSPVPEFEHTRRYTATDVINMRAAADAAIQRRLRHLVANVHLEFEPTFMTDFGEPAEGILRAAGELHPDLIVMGLRPRTHVGTISHLRWSTAYEVICDAECPLLTVRTENSPG